MLRDLISMFQRLFEAQITNLRLPCDANPLLVVYQSKQWIINSVLRPRKRFRQLKFTQPPKIHLCEGEAKAEPGNTHALDHLGVP